MIVLSKVKCGKISKCFIAVLLPFKFQNIGVKDYKIKIIMQIL